MTFILIGLACMEPTPIITARGMYCTDWLLRSYVPPVRLGRRNKLCPWEQTMGISRTHQAWFAPYLLGWPFSKSKVSLICIPLDVEISSILQVCQVANPIGAITRDLSEVLRVGTEQSPEGGSTESPSNHSRLTATSSVVPWGTALSLCYHRVVYSSRQENHLGWALHHTVCHVPPVPIIYYSLKQ